MRVSTIIVMAFLAGSCSNASQPDKPASAFTGKTEVGQRFVLEDSIEKASNLYSVYSSMIGLRVVPFLRYDASLSLGMVGQQFYRFSDFHTLTPLGKKLSSYLRCVTSVNNVPQPVIINFENPNWVIYSGSTGQPLFSVPAANIGNHTYGLVPIYIDRDLACYVEDSIGKRINNSYNEEWKIVYVYDYSKQSWRQVYKSPMIYGEILYRMNFALDKINDSTYVFLKSQVSVNGTLENGSVTVNLVDRNLQELRILSSCSNCFVVMPNQFTTSLCYTFYDMGAFHTDSFKYDEVPYSSSYFGLDCLTGDVVQNRNWQMQVSPFLGVGPYFFMTGSYTNYLTKDFTRYYNISLKSYGSDQALLYLPHLGKYYLLQATADKIYIYSIGDLE